MRFLHGADFHLGLNRHSKPGTSSRLDDFAATLLRFADVAVEQKVDAVLLSGDMFHTRRPTPRDLHALSRALRRLQTANVVAVILSGNHDGPDAVGDARTGALAWMQALLVEGVRVHIEPYAGVVQTTGGSFNLVAIPYPHKNSFDASRPDLSPEERVEEISRTVESAIATKIEQVQSENPSLPTVFMGHLSTVGAALGTETSMRFGWDVTIRSAILDACDYGALGHIHRQQKVGQKSWYAGSPEYMDFGEIGHPKGFLLATVEVGQDPIVEVIDSFARPMVLLDAHREGDEWRLEPATFSEGAIVRVRIHVGTAPLSGAERASIGRAVMRHGASYVQAEIVSDEPQAAVRIALDPQVEASEALRQWLLANGHPEEPAFTVGKSIIQSVGEMG